MAPKKKPASKSARRQRAATANDDDDTATAVACPHKGEWPGASLQHNLPMLLQIGGRSARYVSTTPDPLEVPVKVRSFSNTPPTNRHPTTDTSLGTLRSSVVEGSSYQSTYEHSVSCSAYKCPLSTRASQATACAAIAFLLRPALIQQVEAVMADCCLNK